MNPDNNLYHLLSLPIGVTDVSVILRAIDKVGGDLSSKSLADAEQEREAGLKLALLSDFKSKIGNPALLPAFLQGQRELEQQRQEKGRKADDELLAQTVKSWKARAVPGCTSDDINKLMKRMQCRDEAWVRRELDRNGVKIDTGAPVSSAARPTPPTLPQPIQDGLHSALGILVKAGVLATPSLYALLPGATRSASCDELAQVAEDQIRELHLTGRSDTITQTKKDLLGSCKTLLGNKEQRARYDYWESTRELDRLWQEIIELAVGKDKLVMPQHQQDFLRQACACGVKLADAQMCLEEKGRKRGLFLVGDVKLPEDLLQCGFCDALALSSKDTHCWNCRKALRLKCPNSTCSAIVPTKQAGCSKCGYATGNAPLYTAWLEQAGQLFEEGKAEPALKLIAKVLRGWHGYPAAVELQNRILTWQEAEVHLGQEMDAILRERKGIGADKLFGRIPPAHPQRSTWRDRIDKLLSQASERVRCGRQLQGKGQLDPAVEQYEEALRICIDHDEARQALKTCPPAPPGQMRAEVEREGVCLSWSASSSRGSLLYRVVRKSGSPPHSPSDGMVVVTVAGTSCTDTGVPPGEVTHYAVYTERGGAPSLTATVSGPLIRVAEVSKLQALGRDATVNLSWAAPPNVVGIEVWRQPGTPPARRGIGERLNVTLLDGAVDAGLKNGLEYGYLVVAVFRGLDGQPLYSRGATTSATPVALPRPVEDLQATQSGRDLHVSWTPPPTGNVQVFVAKQPPTRRPGELLALVDLDPLGQRLQILGPGKAQGPFGTDPVLYLVPVTVVATTAVVGQSLQLTRVPDVSGLQVQREEDRLVCRWRWPEGINTAFVLWRSDHYADSGCDPKAQRRMCRQPEYCLGSFEAAEDSELEVLEGNDLFVTIYAAVQVEGKWQLASGTSEEARRRVPLQACRRLRYQLKSVSVWKNWWPTKMYELRITPDAPLTLPSLVLVVSSGMLPNAPENGTVIPLNVGQPCTPDQPFVKQFTPSQLPTNPRGQLFPKGPESAVVRIG